MPSNTMTISQLVRFLQKQQEVHGDVDCVLQVSELGSLIALDGSNINMSADIPGGGKLPQPALVFGIWLDARVGQITNSPGQAYQVTIDGRSNWNTNRDAAPENTPLRVQKRFLGQDRGYRCGDKWFVYEGGDKPIEIIPAGILQWRLDA